MNESPLSWTVAGKTIDRSNCDQEKIHLIGGIQQHGCLLVLHLPEWKVLQASENVATYLGISAKALCGQAVDVWLAPEDRERLGGAAAGCH
jgi:chemotaxis family two-component system sensor kinase Cph1